MFSPWANGVNRRLRLLPRLYRWQWHLKTNCHLATYYSLKYFTFILLTHINVLL